MTAEVIEMDVEKVAGPVEVTDSEGSPLTGTLAAMRAAQMKVTEVEGQRAAYAAELAGIEAQDPARMLDDPDGAAEDADRAEALRRRIWIHDGALDVARRRAETLRREALEIEAAAYEPAIEEARAAVEKHVAKVARLRDQLTALSGLHWVPEPLAVDPAHQGRTWFASQSMFQPTVEERLQAEVAKAERPAAILRAVATGDRVEASYDELPECLQRGGWADLGWATPAETEARLQAAAERSAAVLRAAFELAETKVAAYLAACETWKTDRQERDASVVVKAYFAAEDARLGAAREWNGASPNARELVTWTLDSELPLPPWGRVPRRPA